MKDTFAPKRLQFLRAGSKQAHQVVVGKLPPGSSSSSSAEQSSRVRAPAVCTPTSARPPVCIPNSTRRRLSPKQPCLTGFLGPSRYPRTWGRQPVGILERSLIKNCQKDGLLIGDQCEKLSVEGGGWSSLVWCKGAEARDKSGTNQRREEGDLTWYKGGRL